MRWGSVRRMHGASGPAVVRSGGLPWRACSRPLDDRARAAVAASVAKLLGWQRTLGRWPRAPGVPEATPFVSLYAGGRLRGCFGSTEGDAGDQLQRAFLSALSDPRFGGIQPSERDGLVAEVSYLVGPRRVSHAELRRRFELGVHGLAAASPGRGPVLLLPEVARDQRADLGGLLRALSAKAGLDSLESAELFLFSAESVRVRGGVVARARPRDPVDAAGRWLAGRVEPDGAVAFAVDARARTTFPQGVFRHGRAAVVIHALSAHGGHPGVAKRASRWLEEQILDALSGRRVPDFPDDPAQVAGTVALAVLAGLDLERELGGLSKRRELRGNAWHAAQVVAAMGPHAPALLWQACVRDLEARPWAPWTVLAARARGDADVVQRAERALVDSIRKRAPYQGAADVTPVPEVALTAAVAEALGGSRSRAAQAARKRAQSFLLRAQLLGDRIPAALDPMLSDGAFPLSPILDVLRADVTGHALLALL